MSSADRPCRAEPVMTPPKEVEIKLELAPADLPKLETVPFVRAVGARRRRTSEVSVYFDTDRHKLRRHGLTLRVRRPLCADHQGVR